MPFLIVSKFLKFQRGKCIYRGVTYFIHRIIKLKMIMRFSVLIVVGVYKMNIPSAFLQSISTYKRVYLTGSLKPTVQLDTGLINQHLVR